MMVLDNKPARLSSVLACRQAGLPPDSYRDHHIR
jgi:hypothetical protein